MTHIRVFILRGLLAAIPITLSWFAIQLIYLAVDKSKVVNLINRMVGYPIQGWASFILGIFFVLIVLYSVGLLASNVIGRRVFNLIESITKRIPILKTTYQIGKQVSLAFSIPEKQAFKKVVLVDYLRHGVYIPGFVTGAVVNEKTKEKFLKIFIPSVPNPTTGFMLIAREKDTIDPQWSVEEAMRTIISGGIIGPGEIGDNNRSSNVE